MASALPPLYDRWVSELLAGGSLPVESKATCGSCAMVADAPERSRADSRFFSAQAKCCTFAPTLPNFLVGGVLADETPESSEGRERLRELLRARVGVTPLGLTPPPVAALLYKHGAERAFGQSVTLRCPHYVDRDGGLCGIWRHRNSVCSTWFCKHTRGAAGAAFWQSLLRFLDVLERELARRSLLDVGLEPDAIALLVPFPDGRPAAPLTAVDLDGGVDDDAYQRMWGRFLGREEELYRSCAEAAASMDLAELLARSGADLAIAAALARESYRRLVDVARPVRLRLGRFEVVSEDRENQRICTYSKLDPLDAPRALMNALHRFEGGDVDAVLAELEAEGILVDPDTVDCLVDFGVLIPRPASEPETPRRA